MHIKPTAGLKVRDPISRQLLPADGVDVSDQLLPGVPDNPYWRQLIRFGDVEVVPPAKVEPGAPPAAKVEEPEAAEHGEHAEPAPDTGGKAGDHSETHEAGIGV